MNVGQIYGKTLKFVWLKLALGAVITVASVLLLALFWAISSWMDNPAVFAILIFVWAGLTAVLYKVAMHYGGYMIKAAHVAVISQAVSTGTIPENMFEAGKNMVKERFGATNVYFVVDGLVSGAVKQLQNVVGKIDNIFGNIPGVSAIVSFVQLFIGIALGYIDECCLGYTFYKKEDGAFKASCDGVAIYFQNAKHLLKSALVTTLIVMGATLLAWLVPFLLIGAICSLLDVSWWISALISVLIAAMLKAAFVDSFMMVKTMVSYMEVAPSTEITFDIYGKLCKISSKFKSLFNKAKEETPTMEIAE
ncbi:MAG: hypothetical protein E7268_11340 [Lachnospiraceae bacterium]|nr:hypothetical protein [Lachnospiraceae bacterium]